MSCTLAYSLSGITGDCSNLSGGSFTITITGSAPTYSIEWLFPFSNTVLFCYLLVLQSHNSLVSGKIFEIASAHAFATSICSFCVPFSDLS